MTIFNTYKKEGAFLLVLLVMGQFLFAMISSRVTAPHYEGRIYATTAVRHQQEDLHKLNEAAHYFGQTMIGWLKFPNFYGDLSQTVSLPEGASLSAHIQERQNIIFVVSSPTPLEQESLLGVTDFIQGKIDNYNEASRTEFNLSNLDYELVEIRRSYQFGAIVTLLVTLVIGLGLVFVWREFRWHRSTQSPHDS